ncbi:MAG TPA: hypothetical protein VGJ84_17260 [Polyangiaceae bacterium]
MKLTVEVEARTEAILKALGSGVGCQTAEETLDYIIMSIVDGVRRPGSWERQLLPSLFGEGLSKAERVAG